MKKKVLTVMLLSLSVALCLGGCGKKKKQADAGKNEPGTEQTGEAGQTEAGGEEEEIEDLTEDEVEYTTEYGAISDGATWGYNYEGSAVYTDGKTVVVTIAVNDENADFEKAELDKMKADTKKALDFITKTAKEYGKNAEFVFDEPELNLEYHYDDNAEDFEYDDYDSILTDLIKEKLDTAAIKEKYKADGIMYVFLLNAVGDSFSSPHWVEDEEYYFNEAAYIFKQSYDDNFEEVTTGPNVYLYQILQLFGAVQLDYPDATSGYTSALMEAVEDNYNNDIMTGVFENDGSIAPDEVTKEITDVTAYAIGLVDTFDELEANPTFKKEYRCSFVDNYSKNTKDGTDTSEYEYIPAGSSDDAGAAFEIVDEDEEDEEEEEDEDEDEDDENAYGEVNLEDVLKQQGQ